MQVSGGIIILASSGRRASHDPLTKLGGSLRAPIGQLHDLKLNGTRFVFDRTQRRFYYLVTNRPQRAAFNSAPNNRPFLTVKSCQNKVKHNTETARTSWSCVERPEGFPRAPRELQGSAARGSTAAPRRQIEWSEILSRSDAPLVTARLSPVRWL